MRHLDAVQRAVDTAARRHRESIIKAIASIPDEQEPEPEADESSPRHRHVTSHPVIDIYYIYIYPDGCVCRRFFSQAQPHCSFKISSLSCTRGW